ncbi:MAG: helix-turn-helix domain-containing protein [Propionibacteriaceae bacterium]|nr:helix-turn-helix domain-containing protein [Propionibacteriaceae bacterium]
MANVDLMVRAATLSYLQQLSQSEIAAELGISRQSVSRLLKQALNEGIVHIEITPPAQTVELLAGQLVKRYGLADAVVVSTVGVAERSIRRLVVKAGAQYLTNHLDKVGTLGVNWGRTILDVSYHLPRVEYPDIQVVQLNGSFPGIVNGGPELVINNVAQALSSSHVTTMNAPMFVDSKAVQQVLMHDSRIAAALALARNADAALFTVANASRKSDLYRLGYLKEQDIKELGQTSAVGEIGGKFFDENGQPAAESFAERCVSLELAELLAIPQRICVAVGDEKSGSVKAGLRGGYITALIIDDALARGILADS